MFGSAAYDAASASSWGLDALHGPHQVLFVHCIVIVLEIKYVVEKKISRSNMKQTIIYTHTKEFQIPSLRDDSYLRRKAN